MPRKPPVAAEEIRLVSTYHPDKIPAQIPFHSSKASIRGYGGAVGGGKSRAICEEAYRLSLEYPGLKTVIARQAHTSIVETTRHTMIEDVLPPGIIKSKKESGGEDYVELHNGSVIHFIGLDDPIRWFSSELGLLIFDEAHEVEEDTVVKLGTRLRQRCLACRKKPETDKEGRVVDCDHMPNKTILSFNPENPGHWLHHWFIIGAAQTEWGTYRKELFPKDADSPIGDAEFFFSRATDNPFLSRKYIDEKLAGLPAQLKKRYLDGEWVHVEGTCFFDLEALEDIRDGLKQPYLVGDCHGDITGQDAKDPIKIRGTKAGKISVWKPPVREHYDDKGEKVWAHRYLCSVDVSSGGAQDYSAIQVIDVESFEQVARYQGKIDPDIVALDAFRLARIYNDALIAPEITGGWGFSVVKELQRISQITPHKVRIYTRPIIDRLTNKFTDKLGWNTTVKTRAYMLDTLERVIREREFRIYDAVTYAEMTTFVRDAKLRPAAQPGCNDDLVTSLAIGVTLAATMPKQLRRVVEKQHVPELAATGW